MKRKKVKAAWGDSYQHARNRGHDHGSAAVIADRSELRKMSAEASERPTGWRGDELDRMLTPIQRKPRSRKI